MPTADPDLAALVAAARERKTDATGYVTRSPMQFAEAIQRAARRANDLWQAGGPEVDDARWWSRWLVADAADDQAVDAMAMGRMTSIALKNLVDGPWGLPPGLAPEGEGLELLRRPGQGVVVAVVHSAIPFATFYGAASAMGRPLFIPDGARGKRSRLVRGEARAPSRAETIRIEAERVGCRLVGPERRYEVVRELLLAGEACVLSADHAGTGEGTLFGRSVRTSTAPARLALETGVPLVVLAGRRQDTDLSVRVSAPIGAAARGSVESLYHAVLAAVETELEDDPAQIVKENLPLAAHLEWHAQRRRLRDEHVQARADLAAQRAVLARADETLAQLRAAGAPRLKVDRCKAERDSAKATLRSQRQNARRLRDEIDALKRPEPPRR